MEFLTARYDFFGISASIALWKPGTLESVVWNAEPHATQAGIRDFTSRELYRIAAILTGPCARIKLLAMDGRVTIMLETSIEIWKLFHLNISGVFERLGVSRASLPLSARM